MFADDLLILGPTDKEIHRKLKIVQNWCEDNKMEINFDKTKILDKDKDRLWPVWSADTEKWNSVESVNSFPYLGVPISFKGQIMWTYGPHHDQIVARAKKYKAAIFKIGVDSIDRGEAIKVCWENVALPSILFGCETTNFSKKTIEKLEQIQCQVAKLCLGVRWDTSGLGSRVETGMMSMSSRIMTRQLNYLNSILKRPNGNVYQAWMENTYGGWKSPLKKMWSDIKSKSYTYGVFQHKRVKEYVMMMENISIEREMKGHDSLQFMTSHKIKSRGPYIKRLRFQDILKVFRVGDWRLGIKELKQPVVV